MKRVVGMASCILTLLMLFSATARAEFPDQTIKIILGFGAGGALDVPARWYADKLRELSGVPVIVDNKPGASGNIATDLVAKSAPTGHTLMIAGSGTLAGATYTFQNLPFNVVRDLTPIAPIFRTSFVLAVNPERLPVSSAAELAARLKSRGRKATFGWSVTSALAAGVLYVSASELDAIPVNYKTTVGSVSDLMAGEVDFIFCDLPYAVSQQKSGKIRILAANSPERSVLLPSVPTMKEAGYPAAEMSTWVAFWASSKTPMEVVDKLTNWINKISEMPQTQKLLISVGTDPMTGSTAQAKQMLNESLASWRKATELGNITAQ